jgi:hypothetical protein
MPLKNPRLTTFDAGFVILRHFKVVEARANITFIADLLTFLVTAQLLTFCVKEEHEFLLTGR